MALGDIVFNEGDPQNFILEMMRGNVGTINDALTGYSTAAETLLSEIPKITSSGTGSAGPTDFAY